MLMSEIFSICIFVLSMSITPGPNNVMLAGSGAIFGYKRTLPHIFGIIFGLFCLNLLSALGLQKLFILFPILKSVLKFGGVFYMFYLAFKIFTAKGIRGGKSTPEPFKFIQGAIFQFLNPKAVLMSLTAMSVYTNSSIILSASCIIIIFILIGFPSISLWAVLGRGISLLLKKDKFARAFNYSLGILTAFAGIILLL